MTRLGELLVGAGKITTEQLEEALSAQQGEGGRVGTHLVKMGFIDDDDLVEFLSQRYGVPAINLGEIEVTGNGNVLITSSKEGRVFEVTRDGELAWDYRAPNFDVGRKRARGAVYRSARIAPGYLRREVRSELLDP